MSAKQLILASASPRRGELLEQLGVVFTCVPADIDETPATAEKPADYVQRMAWEKAHAVATASDMRNCVVLAADTTVVIDEDVLGKPVDHFDGLGILARLSGRSHSVLTAICVLDEDGKNEDLVETRVEFARLTREMCEAYLATDEPWDKAGAYAIQGLGGAFVRSISGSYSNVVGLPLHETWCLLREYAVSTGMEPASE